MAQYGVENDLQKVHKKSKKDNKHRQRPLSSPQAASFLTTLGAMNSCNYFGSPYLETNFDAAYLPEFKSIVSPSEEHGSDVGNARKISGPFDPPSAPMNGVELVPIGSMMEGVFDKSASALSKHGAPKTLSGDVMALEQDKCSPIAGDGTDSVPPPELSARGRHGAALLAHSLAVGLPKGFMMPPASLGTGRLSIGTERAWAGLQSTPSAGHKP